MARLTVEAPWMGIVFPKRCASCSSPTVEKQETIKRPTQAQEHRLFFGYLLAGLIGALITGSRREYVRFNIPLCKGCVARERWSKAIPWALLLLGFLAVAVLPFLLIGPRTDNTWALWSVFLGLGLVLFSVVLIATASTRGPVVIRVVKDRSQGVVLSFRNTEYGEEFRQVNLPCLIPYELRAGLPLSIPPEQAMAIVSRNMDDSRPDATDTLAGHFYRALIHMRTEAYVQALDDLDRVISVGGYNPFLPEAYFLRAQALLQLARYQEAADDLEAFIRASADEPRVKEAKRLLKKVSAYR